MSLRKELLDRVVPFKTREGALHTLPFSRIYQHECRGTALLALVREWESTGHIEPATDAQASGFIDLSNTGFVGEKLYGREGELAELLEAVDRFPMIAVTGVAGIGKTTLGSMVCRALRGTRSLYWRRVRPWDTALDLAFAVASFLKAIGRQALSSYLASGGSKSMTRTEELLAADLADTRILLVFDDVHTATQDAATFLSMLKEVLSRNGGACAILLSRAVPKFYGRRDVEVTGSVFELPLRGLEATSAKALLADAGVPSPRMDWFTKVGGRNPLFLKILLGAHATGTTQRARYTIARYIADEIEASLTSDERACIQLASLYEMPVPPAGLEIASPRGITSIAHLQMKGLMDQTDEGRLLVHDFLRQYFQSTLSPEERVALVDKAVPWLVAEAGRAKEGHNGHGAIALLANAAMIEVNQTRRGSLLERLGELRYTVGDLPGAVEAFRTALELTGDAQIRARLHSRLSFALFPFRRDDETMEEIRQGLELVAPEPSLVGAWLHYSRAIVVFHHGDFTQSRHESDVALDWMTELPEDLELIGSLLCWKGILLVYDPAGRDFSLAESYFRASADAFARVRTASQYWPHECLALVALETGRIDEGLRALDKAQTLCEAPEATPAGGNIAFLRAWALSECTGDYDAAEALYHEAYGTARSAFERYRLIWFDRCFADLYWHQGRLTEAKEALTNFLQIGGRSLRAELATENFARLARLSAEARDLASADSALDRAQRAAQDVPSDASNYCIEWARGKLQTIRGDLGQARARFAQLLSAEPPIRTGNFLQEHLLSGSLRGEMLIDYARLLFADGAEPEARVVLLEARDEFTKLGRNPLRQTAERLLNSPEVETPSAR